VNRRNREQPYLSVATRPSALPARRTAPRYTGGAPASWTCQLPFPVLVNSPIEAPSWKLTKAQACRAGPVAIVGGGNSAGQAALFLSRSSAGVHVIIRAETLDTSMSRYLIDQVERDPALPSPPGRRSPRCSGKIS
jgi:hypothetical protein